MKEWNVPDDWSESGREFQIVGVGVWKDREPKIKSLRGTWR